MRSLTLVVIALSALMSLPAESRQRNGGFLRDLGLQIEVLPPRDFAARQNLGLAPGDNQNMPQNMPMPRELALDRSQVAVPPSEAAAIAQDAVPGGKVVGVRLLPSGYYAVTLRVGGSVTRVMVNAMDGSVR